MNIDDDRSVIGEDRYRYQLRIEKSHNSRIVIPGEGVLKFNAPKNFKVRHVISMVRAKIDVSGDTSINIMLNNTILKPDISLEEIYEKRPKNSPDDNIIQLVLCEMVALGGRTRAD